MADAGHGQMQSQIQSEVIDLWAPIVPTPEILAWGADNFPDQMLDYLRIFYKQEPTQAAFRERARDIALTSSR